MSTATPRAPPGSARVSAHRVARARLCGVGDEAGRSLDAQIAAHHALGWTQIELRSIDGVRVDRLDDATVARIADRLQEAGIAVPVLASSIGDWSATIQRDFDEDLLELERLMSSAERLRAPFIRIMSYPAGDMLEDGWRTEVLRRVVELSRHAADHGRVLLHENCHGWAACDPERALALVEATDGRGLALLFDVGNPVVHGYDGFAYLARVFPWVAHLHVKDGLASPASGQVTFTPPGEGAARVLDCIDLALDAGYAGALSIEPHLAVLPHNGVRACEATMQAAYLAYGRRFMALLADRLAPAEEVA